VIAVTFFLAALCAWAVWFTYFSGRKSDHDPEGTHW